MKRILFTLLLGLVFVLPAIAQAQGFESKEVRAEITEIHSVKEGEFPSYTFTAETEEGSVYEIDTYESYPSGFFLRLAEGQEVILQVFHTPDGETSAVLSDLVRTSRLIWLFVLFAIITVFVGLWRGLSAIFGLALTVAVLFLFVFPKILAGWDPVTTTVIGSVVILAINMHLSHGVKKKTFVAFLGTLVGLSLVVVFAHLFISIAKLSGLGSEEAMFVYVGIDALKVPGGLLLSGIILGAVGVLDDISIAQSEVVTELLDANHKLSRKELFVRSMRVGRHHIASTVNTLVLAYAGASLPLFLLFMYAAISPEQFLNTELVAEEVIRTLAGTTALVLTVPITTWFSVLAQQSKRD